MKKLQSKVALVTGGNSGIGFVTAKLLHEQGAKIAISGRDRKTLDQAASAIGEGTFGVVADVSSSGDLDKLLSAVSDGLGKIDILFANAGVGKFAPMSDNPEPRPDQTAGPGRGRRQCRRFPGEPAGLLHHRSGAHVDGGGAQV
jgi:NAD(P)-dependent dehydrogenase (short-subunit alcohol dehydrogenase family)